MIVLDFAICLVLLWVSLLLGFFQFPFPEITFQSDSVGGTVATQLHSKRY